MDGLRLLAARIGADRWRLSSCPPRVVVRKDGGGDPARPEVEGRQPEGAWITAARGDQLRRNGKTHAPGEARSPRALPTFPTVRPGSGSTCPKGASALSSRPRSRARSAASPAPGEPNLAAAPAGLDLFAPLPEDDPGAADPVALSRTATLASGRAMAARLWPEARALAALAESYARLAQQAARCWDYGRDQEPTEAEFEAVRRKVMGWDAMATEAPPGSDAADGAPDGGPG